MGVSCTEGAGTGSPTSTGHWGALNAQSTSGTWCLHLPYTKPPQSSKFFGIRRRTLPDFRELVLDLLEVGGAKCVFHLGLRRRLLFCRETRWFQVFSESGHGIHGRGLHGFHALWRMLLMLLDDHGGGPRGAVPVDVEGSGSPTPHTSDHVLVYLPLDRLDLLICHCRPAQTNYIVRPGHTRSIFVILQKNGTKTTKQTTRPHPPASRPSLLARHSTRPRLPTYSVGGRAGSCGVTVRVRVLHKEANEDGRTCDVTIVRTLRSRARNRTTTSNRAHKSHRFIGMLDRL